MEPKPGQIWKDLDPRLFNRKVVIEDIRDGKVLYRSMYNGHLGRSCNSRISRFVKAFVFQYDLADINPSLKERQVRHMVQRFLGWHLPDNFHPDGGISFKKIGNEGTRYEYERKPVGTNLLDAAQAEEMVRFMMKGMPEKYP